jgi:mannose-6-phosphate isomerase-like protein (cupin superfamily)
VAAAGGAEAVAGRCGAACVITRADSVVRSATDAIVKTEAARIFAMAVQYSVAMMKTTLTVLVIAGLAGPAFAQTSTPPVVGITAAEIQAVMKYQGAEGAGTDRQIRVADLGDYRLGVGVLQRGPTKPGAPIAAISHSKVTEAFYIISGSGTLVTGMTVENDRPFPPETEFVRLAVGPSSGGVFTGGDRRPVAAGDVVIVPAGVPHGFDDITDHLTYLSIRPDLAGVLPPNYVHPALKK